MAVVMLAVTVPLPFVIVVGLDIVNFQPLLCGIVASRQNGEGSERVRIVFIKRESWKSFVK